MAERNGVMVGDFYLATEAEANEIFARTGERVPYLAGEMDNEFGTGDSLAVTALDLDPQFGCTAKDKIARATGRTVVNSYPGIW